MKRINYKELTVGRVSSFFVRKLTQFPSFVLWKYNKYLNSNIYSSVSQLKNKHDGERVFILANGPSLKKVDFSLLKENFSIGLNRIYLLEKEVGFLPDYLVVVNDLVLSQFSDDLNFLETNKFFPFKYKNKFHENRGKNYFFSPSLSINDGFSKNFSDVVYTGGTVTFVALQLAFFLGFKEVILLGLDHDFVEKGIPNKTEIRSQDVDQSHFHPEYFPKGVKWQLPDLVRSEIAYSLAKEFYEKHGRSIVDATEGGKCEIFKKVNLVEYLNADKKSI